jgi:hypothetical protein
MSDILSKEELSEFITLNKHTYARILTDTTHTHVYKMTLEYVNANYTGKTVSERCYKYIYGIQLCGSCGGELPSKNFISFFQGYNTFHNRKCRHTSEKNKTPKPISNSPELTNLELESLILSSNWLLINQGFKYKYPILYGLINNFSGRSGMEKCYKYLHGEKLCLNCSKLLGGKGFLGFRSGYRVFCSDVCAAKHPYRLNKIKATNLARYGAEWLFTTNNTKQQIKDTNLKHWGVEHISQNVEIHKRQHLNGYRRKDYKFPSGKVIQVQGYEPFALNELIKTYSEDDIITDKSLLPKFQYTTPDNKIHRYYPDILIKSENLIIEVKSEWTGRFKENIIELKRQSVIDSGYNYKQLTYNRKGELINK